MPSKKKNSRTPSKLSNSDQNGDFSSSPAVSTSISSIPNSSNDQLLSSLDEASAKFPSLISRTAFIGTVVDKDVSKGRKGCAIWLPESDISAMSPSVTPGSLVSVSLYSMEKSLGGFPLSALSDECARHFGFDLAENLADEAGNFFSLATVLPSREVSKNGVRLSLDLWYTLGCPASGRTIFVCPVESHSSSENGINKQWGLAASCISLDSCKELYLSPVNLKGKVEMEGALQPQLHLFKEDANSQIVNSKISSSKMPSLSMSKLGPPCSQLAQEHDSSRKCLETCIRSWLYGRSLLSGNFVRVPVLSRHYVFRVVCSEDLLPNSENVNRKNHDLPYRDPKIGKEIVQAFLLNLGTKIHLLLPGNPMVETSLSSSLAYLELGHIGDNMGVNFPKLGGLSNEFAVLKDLIVSSAQLATKSSVVRPIKGVLLHGPTGIGKTALARVCAYDAGVNMFTLDGLENIFQRHGEIEEELHEVFDKASKSSPAVVFIDELDAVAPPREEGDDVSRGIVGTLLDLIDDGKTDGVLIIATTSHPDSVEPKLRKPGRIDREIVIGVPTRQQRHEILLALLSERNHSLSDKDIENLTLTTYGFVGADLDCLCNQATLVRLKQYFESTPNHGETQNSSNVTDGIRINESCDLEDPLRITLEDFEKARVRVRPSAMREINIDVPNVRWEDVGGQMEVKKQLMETVVWPQKYKENLNGIGARPPTGILLFGPPGCSKTLLARAVATEAGLNFLAVKGPELFSKWVGESEKSVRSLFAKARANAPCIIFFDEFDGLTGHRGQEGDGTSVGDRVTQQLLIELDGLQQREGVIVIAATNRPDKIDEALIRSGRFDRVLYVGPPNRKDREEIFRIHLRKVPCSSDVCISELALLTEGSTGAYISHICNQAKMKAIEENDSALEITMEHLKAAIQEVEPPDYRMYEKMAEKFQRFVPSIAEEGDLIREPFSDKPIHTSIWTRTRSALLFLFRRLLSLCNNGKTKVH